MAKHNKVGKIGEQIAVDFLKKEKYKIIHKNFSTKYAEIDIICKKKPLVFVEVKTRTGDRFGLPEDSINKEKIWRLERSAQAYTAFKNYKGIYRVDAVCIVLNKDRSIKRIKHYKNITGF